MTRGMDVLIVTHTARLGGAELALLRLCEGMLSHCRLRVISFEDGELVERLRRLNIGVDVLSPPGSWVTGDRSTTGGPLGFARFALGATWHAARVAARIRALKPDVVQSWTLKAHLVTTLAYPLYSQPLAWYLHDRITADYLGHLNRAVVTTLSWVPQIVLANSHATAETIPRSCTVAYPGLAPDQFGTARDCAAQACSSCPEILLLGRISPTKGQREAILALTMLRERIPTARLRIVGTALFGEERYERECRDLAARLGLSDAVDFAGHSADPRADLDRATVLVHASPVPEPFGQVVAEAMARGVPVVATDAGGVRELLRSGQGTLGQLATPGYPVALADALAAILTRPTHAAAQADRAFDAARQRFTIERTVQVVTSAWRRAADGRPLARWSKRFAPAPRRRRPWPVADRLMQSARDRLHWLQRTAEGGSCLRNEERPTVAYLFVSPWQHEFDSYVQGHVPSHRLFFAHELGRRGYSIQFYDRPVRGDSKMALARWRLGQAWWATTTCSDVVVATHESAAYPSLLLRRAKPIHPAPVVVLSVATPRTITSKGPAARLRKFLLSGADLLTVYSRDQLEPLRRLLPATDISFLPLGVDTSYFRSSTNRPPGSGVLAVGTNEGKDYPTLIQALPDDCSLTIITDQYNIRESRPYAGDKRVTFRSNVPIEELRRLYQQCKVLVLPLKDSAMSTGQTVLLENISLGTPVIVTDVPCIRDYVDGSVVTLVPQGDVNQLRRALLGPPADPGRQAFQYGAEQTAVILDGLIRNLRNVT